MAAYAMYRVHTRATIDETASVIRRHLGKDLVFPMNADYTLLGEKTLPPKAWKKRHKMLVYLGKEQCKSYGLLPKWQQLMKECEKKHPDLGFVFVAHTDNYTHLESEFCHAGFFYPVMYDYNNEFQKANSIPENSDFHACLLDEKNTVLFVGSPVMGPNVWKECENVMTLNNLTISNSRKSKKPRNPKSAKTTRKPGKDI